MFAVAAFALASLAAQSWRELAVLIALTVACIFPIKWLGIALGFPAFAANTIIAETTASGGFRYGITPSAALLAAIITGSVVMILWRHVTTKPDAGDKKADEKNGQNPSRKF